MSNKPPTSRTQSQQHSDDPNSTGTNLTNGNNRKRQPGGQHAHSQHPPRDGGKQSNTRSGNSVQMRARDNEEREGGTIRHSNRHSWDSDTATQLQNRGTADKIERSQSARFDRMTAADTSNRFERLNPDAEAPGEAKPGSTRNRKRNSRSVSGSSSYRSRSPKRKSGKDQKGSQAGREKDNVGGTTTTASCELEWDSGTKQQDGELVSEAEKLAEPTSTADGGSGSTPVQLLDQTPIDKTSGASAQGGDGSSATASDSGEKGENIPSGGDSEKTKQIRLSYTRVSFHYV